MDKTISFLLKVNDLQKTKRYGHYEKFWESTSEHIFKLVLIVDYFYHELKLDLNYEDCMHYALYHDFGEMDLKMDIDAKESEDKNVNKLKTEQEQAKINFLSTKYYEPIAKYYEAYQSNVTKEAKFVRACDKIEACIHVLSIDSPIMNPEFFATYADKCILDFPELLPVYRKIKKLMREAYQKYNLEWKEEYEL